MEEKKKRYGRLSLYELQSMHVMREAGARYSEISKALGRSKSTVHEGLVKHRHPNWRVWYGMSACERARHVYEELEKERGGRRREGHLKDPVVRAYVIECLVDLKWTPEMIAGRIGLELPGKSVCAKTIYTFIKKERTDLTEYLRERGKKRRQRVAHRRGRFQQAAPTKRSVHERPELVEYRAEIGHLEGDLIISNRESNKAILSLTDRATRQKIFRVIPDHTAATVLAYLRAILFMLPQHMRKTLTLDNGGEFTYSELIALEHLFPGLHIYYCDPYCSWQKGSVERANREFRVFYPKGSSFESLTPHEVRRVETLINKMPLKCLDYQTPMEMFQIAA